LIDGFTARFLAAGKGDYDLIQITERADSALPPAEVPPEVPAAEPVALTSASSAPSAPGARSSKTSAADSAASKSTAAGSAPPVTTAPEPVAPPPAGKLGITFKIKNSLTGAVVEGDAASLVAMAVEAEVGNRFQPESMKAQAVAAYTLFLYYNAHNGAVPSAPMIAASSKAIAATEAVLGQTITQNGKLINANYCDMSAGKTADGGEVWEGGGYYPYLKSVDDPVQSVPGFASEQTFSAADTANWVRETYQVELSGLDRTLWFRPQYDANNLYAKNVVIGGAKEVLGLRIRDTLFSSARVGSNTLRSHAFTIAYSPARDAFVFSCKGYGHGVGLSQQGADVYARQGYDYRWILRHYYTNVNVG
jgi:stage II sporulation protein D